MEFIKILGAAVVGFVKWASLFAIAVCLCVCMSRDMVEGVVLAVALVAYHAASRLAQWSDSDVSDVDTPPDGEEDYHLF